MINKYYTPSIEELHIGFIIEQLCIDGWKSDKIESGLEIYEIDGIELEGNFRVKYLDQKDIEELGWEYKEEFGLGAKKYTFNKKLKLIHNHKDNTVKIYKGHTTVTDFFDGYIKNYNELKRLMKQLNITQ